MRGIAPGSARRGKIWAALPHWHATMMDGQTIPEATLEVVEAESTRRVARVTESPFLIGRGAEAGNHLQLADRSISRRCAQLVYVDGVFRLEDRG